MQMSYENRNVLFDAIKNKEANQPGPRGYKTFLCSNQLSMKFIMLIHVKMPTIV